LPRSFSKNKNSMEKSMISDKYVIFTADDFGLSAALNGAVALAHQRGLLQNAALMAAAPQTPAALAQAQAMPGLCLGLHLTLIQGQAVLPPRRLPHLVDSLGFFPNNPVATGCRYFRDFRLLPEIRRELAAQIEAVQRTGQTIWFVNSHLNLHLHPRLAPMAVDLCREYGIPALRLAQEDWRTTLALAPDGPVPKIAQGLIFTLLARRAAKIARGAGLIMNDHIFGLLNDGRMTENYLLNLVPHFKPGVTEIYCHPGLFADAELLRWAPRYRRQEELAALMSPRLKAALDAAGIQVTNFRELCRERQNAGP
jgi:chitin disaccharide deacetylase